MAQTLRLWLAILIAPSAPMLLLLLIFLIDPTDSSDTGKAGVTRYSTETILLTLWGMCYTLSYLVGLPLYLLARRLGVRTWPVYTVGAYFMGFAALPVFGIILVLCAVTLPPGESLPAATIALNTFDLPTPFLGLPLAPIGLLFWLITRPDRSTQAAAANTKRRSVALQSASEQSAPEEDPISLEISGQLQPDGSYLIRPWPNFSIYQVDAAGAQRWSRFRKTTFPWIMVVTIVLMMTGFEVAKPWNSWRPVLALALGLAALLLPICVGPRIIFRQGRRMPEDPETGSTAAARYGAPTRGRALAAVLFGGAATIFFAGKAWQEFRRAEGNFWLTGFAALVFGWSFLTGLFKLWRSRRR
jgi:hypothetical protein